MKLGQNYESGERPDKDFVRVKSGLVAVPSHLSISKGPDPELHAQSISNNNSPERGKSKLKKVSEHGDEMGEDELDDMILANSREITPTRKGLS